MTSFVALLRAVNVGGTGKLPMSDLKAICEELGFTSVRTYIASGNVVFASRKDEEIKLGKREIYVHYGEGMGQSKLVIPAAKTGTARNMNTVATVAKMAAELA